MLPGYNRLLEIDSRQPGFASRQARVWAVLIFQELSTGKKGPNPPPALG